MFNKNSKNTFSYNSYFQIKHDSFFSSVFIFIVNDISKIHQNGRKIKIKMILSSILQFAQISREFEMTLEDIKGNTFFYKKSSEG